MKRIKKYIALLIAAILIISSFPVTAFAATQKVDAAGENGICKWSYDAIADTVYIDAVHLRSDGDGKLPLFTIENGQKVEFTTGFSGLVFSENLESISGEEATKITINRELYPELVGVEFNQNAPIDTLPDNLFFDSSVQYVLLSSNLKTIGGSAFLSSNLVEITIPSTVEFIGDLAFSCENLSSVVFEPTASENGLTLGLEIFGATALTSLDMSPVKLAPTMVGDKEYVKIPDFTFYGSFLEEIILPENTTYIGQECFYNSELKNIDLTGVQVIGESAFGGLQSKTFSANLTGVEEIGNLAFSSATIDEIVIPESVTKMGTGVFYGAKINRIEIHAGITKLPESTFERAKLSGIYLAENITEIGQNCFANMYGLTSLDFSVSAPGVQDIGRDAFWYSKLSTVSFKNSKVECLSPRAFYQNSQLQSVDLGDNISFIGASAFDGCVRAKFTELPAVLGYIGSSAFEGTRIENVNIQQPVDLNEVIVDIGKGAFSNCKQLKTVTLSDMVTNIPSNCFENCTALKSVSLPATLTDIGAEAFYGCTLLSDINLSECAELLTIGNSAFYKCALLPNLDLSVCTKLNTIGNNAFYGCSSIREISLEHSKIINFTDGVFENCTSLESVTFSPSVSKIYDNAFLGCTALSKATFLGANTTIATYAFGDNTDVIIIGYSGSTAQKFANTNGFRFQTLGIAPDGPDDLRGTFGNGQWHYNAATNYLTFSGSGAIAADTIKYADGTATTIDEIMSSKIPAFLQFEEGITEIPEYFTTYNNYAFSVSLPSTLKKIGSHAFCNTSVNKIIFPSQIDGLSIGDYAFSNTNIKELHFCNGKITLGAYSFSDMPVLATVAFGNGMTEIGAYSFYNDKLITGVSFSDSIKTIGAYAFCNNAKLASVTLPADLEVIGEGAFQSTIISRINFPAKVNTIGKKAFADCNQLTDITADGVNVDIYLDMNHPADNALGFKSTGAMVTGVKITAGIASTYIDYCEKTGIKFAVNGNGSTYNGYITNSAAHDAYDSETSFRWYYYADTKEFYIAGQGSINGIHLMNMDGTVFNEKLDVDHLMILSGALTLGTAMSQINPKYVSLPNTLLEIYDTAFKNCDRLISLEIPDSVTYLPDRPFIGCTSISNIKFGKNIKKIPNECFKNSTSIKYVDLGAAETIGAQAFMRCPNLEVIEIPDTVTTIESQAFYECLNVASIKLGTGVTNVLDRAFANIPFCDKIVVSSDVFTIYARAFENTGISTSGIDVEYNDNVGVANLRGLEHINVSSITVGKNFTGFKEIITIENLKTINVSENCKNYYVYKNCLYSNDNVLVFAPHNMESVEIKPGTTAIGDKAFMLSGVHVVRIPDGVKSIGEKAFYNAKELKSVRFPETLETIGVSAFEGCEKIKTAYIPYPCQTIEKDAFKNCKLLASVILPDGLKSIGVSCFNSCESLSGIVIPESVETIGSGAFAYIPNMHDVYIWNSQVGYNCFLGSGNARIRTIVSSPAHAFARTYNIPFTAYSDSEAFFDDCAAAIDIFAGYLGYCTDGHGDIEWLTVYEGDCENDGYKIGVCEYCSQVLDEKHITAQGHKYAEVGYIHETSTTAGIRILKCTTCGEQYSTYTEPTGENPACEIHSVSGYITAETGKANAYGNTSLKSVNIVINGMVVARTNKDGYFTFNIKSGTYMAEIQYAYGYTRTVVIIVEDEDIVIKEAIKIVAVDFNSDKKIDDADVALFRVIVSSKEGDASYLDYVDINHDGYINAKDYMIIKQFNGTSELTYQYPQFVIQK